MEERRAVLACFLITSMYVRYLRTTCLSLLRLSSHLQKIDGLRWTPHMDECLSTLDERKECVNDGILVQQVRLQLIIEKMALAGSHDGVVEFIEQREPPSLHLESLHSQFQGLKTAILAESQNNGKLLHLLIYGTYSHCNRGYAFTFL
jgi:hypothetical protein